MSGTAAWPVCNLRRHRGHFKSMVPIPAFCSWLSSYACPPMTPWAPPSLLVTRKPHQVGSPKREGTRGQVPAGSHFTSTCWHCAEHQSYTHEGMQSWPSSPGKTRLLGDLLRTYHLPALLRVLGNKVPAVRNRPCEPFRGWCCGVGILVVGSYAVAVKSEGSATHQPGSPTYWLAPQLSARGLGAPC